MTVFPNDEDGQVLKMLSKQGVDFTEPQNVDFVIAVPAKKNDKAILETLRSEGFNCELEQDEETEEWTCYCFITMLLKYKEIVDIQKRLDELSKPHDGYTEGWGLMVN
ncbi:ribonuclease E inhibitor RraB [Planococcus versutus]|uniref:Cytoplasmic protein n=1 Tax=Planococcus versutus TaxID=1302659 RepID=A0A1B1S501_9BACL|nr:ribonuclease E inhibitor RraB [Planococcus versutus]ANU28272.1 cytoplasmic protein [Planococcus versutus]